MCNAGIMTPRHDGWWSVFSWLGVVIERRPRRSWIRPEITRFSSRSSSKNLGPGKLCEFYQPFFWGMVSSRTQRCFFKTYKLGDKKWSLELNQLGFDFLLSTIRTFTIFADMCFLRLCAKNLGANVLRNMKAIFATMSSMARGSAQHKQVAICGGIDDDDDDDDVKLQISYSRSIHHPLRDEQSINLLIEECMSIGFNRTDTVYVHI